MVAIDLDLKVESVRRLESLAFKMTVERMIMIDRSLSGALQSSTSVHLLAFQPSRDVEKI
jgi:hypothetical protein